MSGIKPGKYIIRKEPSGPYGGMYATRQEEIDLPVVLGAQVPDLIHRQYWYVQAADTESHWRITSFADASTATTILSTENPSGGPVGPVMALFIPINAEGGGAGPDEKLWQKWRITPVDVPGVTKTYTLQPVTNFLGMDYYVGVKDNTNELYVQAFDIRDDSPKPYWQFDFITEEADEAA